MLKYIAFTFVFLVLFLCSCRNNLAGVAQSSDAQTEDTFRTITADMAYEGINNYCHSVYDWSAAKDNPDIMYLTMGEETDSAFQVVFRSYTGAFVHFYVDKRSGTTKIVEKVPNLDVEEDDGEHQSSDGEHQSSAGTINLFDYLGQN